MAYGSHAGRWLATIILCLYPASTPATALFSFDADPGWRRAEDVSGLAAIFEDWLDERAPWPRRSTLPEIRMISGERAASFGGLPGRGHGRNRGLYDAETATIYLVEPWDRRDSQDASVLLHELVHHRQAPHYWYCPAAQEMPAYCLQSEWLGARGLAPRVNWIGVVMEAGCTPKDIHPD